MQYTTIWETRQQSQLVLVKNIFEQNNIDYRILDENSNTNFAIGARVQVAHGQEEKAGSVLRENGLIEDPSPAGSKVAPARFWIWLFIALLVVIIVSYLINANM